MISDYEIVEVCPHCDSENIYPTGSTFHASYKAFCKECGKEIFLCDECMHSLDNPAMYCNWRKENKYNVCMRGRIKNDF